MDTRAQKAANDTSHQRQLVQAVMRRQLALSLKIAAVFMIILLGLPLVNYFMPSFANRPVGGFTLTWLFLAVLFYPVTWCLSWVFIRRSNEIEADIASTLGDDVAGTAIQGGGGVSPLISGLPDNTDIPASTDADTRSTTDNSDTQGENR